MSPKASLITLLLFTCSARAGVSSYEGMTFTGDVLLGRNVAREIQVTGESPWKDIRSLFQDHSYVLGNFEGAIGGQESCQNPELCLVVDQKLIHLLKQVGFVGVGVENNHSDDLGAGGKARTETRLVAEGLDALSYAGSPWFISVKDKTVAVVAYTEVKNGKSGGQENPLTLELAQRIRLGHQLSNLTVVFVHWGSELQDWPSSMQREHARWLIQQGADLIVGHHPHVIQKEECVDGRPVVFSLGNHIFDQKYPLSKVGRVLKCGLSGERWDCRFYRTEVPVGSAFPRTAVLEKENDPFFTSCRPSGHGPVVFKGSSFVPDLAQHAVPSHAMRIRISGLRQKSSIPADSLISIQPAQLTGDSHKGMLLTLQTHFSPIDKEVAPRPYVYDLGPNGLIARWRGSALAWPLKDITPIRDGDRDYLCALHRGDSFLNLDSTNRSSRTQVYEWNGFGFKAANRPSAGEKCRIRYSDWISAAAK